MLPVSQLQTSPPLTDEGRMDGADAHATPTVPVGIGWQNDIPRPLGSARSDSLPGFSPPPTCVYGWMVEWHVKHEENAIYSNISESTLEYIGFIGCSVAFRSTPRYHTTHINISLKRRNRTGHAPMLLLRLSLLSLLRASKLNLNHGAEHIAVTAPTSVSKISH